MSQCADAANRRFVLVSNPQLGTVADQSVTSSTAGAAPAEPDTVDCAICLESCVFPIELTCGHSFCYLCVKGIAIKAAQIGQKPQCSLCRREIAANIISNPRLKDSSGLPKDVPIDKHHWYYECRSGGWWQFEERFSDDLQAAFDANQPTCTLLIAGQIYEVDFVRMVQYPPNNRNIVRRIKLDLATTSKKGIAGIRISSNTGAPHAQTQEGGAQVSAIPSALVNPNRLAATTNHINLNNPNNDQQPNNFEEDLIDDDEDEDEDENYFDEDDEDENMDSDEDE